MGARNYRSVIAIDPGKRSGWARFFDDELREAGTLTDTEILIKPPSVDIGPGIAIIEVPRIYPRKGKGDQNDLIDLAVLVGDLRGFYRNHGFHTRLVAPRSWKGTVPKAIHHERVLGALTSEEIARLPKRPRARTFDHNMLDAVGLGLFQVLREKER